MLQTMTSMMLSSRRASSSITSQLLLIMSDGRGLFLEGMDVVNTAVRKANEAGIFTVFVVIDNPDMKVTIKTYTVCLSVGI